MSDATTDHLSTLFQKHDQKAIIEFFEKLSIEDRQRVLNNQIYDESMILFYPLQYAAEAGMIDVVRYILDNTEPSEEHVNDIVRKDIPLPIFGMLKTRADPKLALMRAIRLGDEQKNIIDYLRTVIGRIDTDDKNNVFVLASKKNFTDVMNLLLTDPSFSSTDNIRKVMKILNDILRQPLIPEMHTNVMSALTKLGRLLYKYAFHDDPETALKLLREYASICDTHEDLLLKAMEKATTDDRYMDIVNYIMHTCERTKKVKQEALRFAEKYPSRFTDVIRVETTLMLS